MSLCLSGDLRTDVVVLILISLSLVLRVLFYVYVLFWVHIVLPFMDAVKFRTIRNIAISFVISVQLETKLYRL